MKVRPNIVIHVGTLIFICTLCHEATATISLYVSNNLTNNSPGGRLLEFDGLTGQFNRLVDNIETPRGIDVGPDGNLYVASANGDSVVKYDITNGGPPTLFVVPSSGGLNFPIGLTFGPDGNLYVTSTASSPAATASVLRYDGATGGFIDVFATVLGTPSSAIGVSFGPDGKLYLATLSSGVFRFDGASGALLGNFVPPINSTLSTAITFGPDNNLYMATGPADTVLRFNGTTGAFIDTFVAAGSGGLDDAEGIRFGPDGNLYVAGLFNDAILRYNGQTGDFIDVFASESIDAPLFFAFVPEPTCLTLFSIAAVMLSSSRCRTRQV